MQDGEVTEEVFEVRARGGAYGEGRVQTRWGTELGRPMPDKDRWVLPSAEWVWADEYWKVDLSGLVEEATGWESSRLDYPDAFRPGRNFRRGDRFFRRRWTRRRVKRGMGAGASGGFGPGVLMFQPRCRQSKAGGAQVVVKVGDSVWSQPLDVGTEGAGGAFQLIGNRWPNLEDQALDRTLYELTYRVTTAPAPWDRTRVLRLINRYTVFNGGTSAIVVAQAGAESKCWRLEPQTGSPLHWPDFQREPVLLVSFPDEEQAAWTWSAGVDIGSISDFPLVIRPVEKPEHSGEGWQVVAGPPNEVRDRPRGLDRLRGID